MKSTHALFVSLFALGFLNVARAEPLGSAFTYQGQLKKAGQRVTGMCCSLEFTLWDDAAEGTCPAGGAQIGPTLTFDGIGANPPAVCPVDGLFTVQLDFGVNAFDGTARWLQMAVQCPGDAGYTTLCPRQELAPSPYAHRARTGVGTLNALNVTTADDVGIGTVNPNAKFEVMAEGSGGDHAAVSARNSNGDSLFFVRDEGRVSIGRSIGTPDFSVQSAQGLVVTSQGDTELNLVGSETQNNVGVASIIFHNTNSTEPKKRVASIVASVAGLSGAHLDFNTENGSFSNEPPRMRITSDGNVGIGTTTGPAAKLHIGGTPGSDGIKFPDGTLQTTASIQAPRYRFVVGDFEFATGILSDFDVIASAPPSKRWFVVSLFVEMTSGYASNGAFRFQLDNGEMAEFPIGNFGFVCGTTRLVGSLEHLTALNGSCSVSAIYSNWSQLEGRFITQIAFGKLDHINDAGTGTVRALILEF